MLQGLVCPGMLVLLTNDQGVKVIQESEYCPLLSPRNNHKLSLNY